MDKLALRKIVGNLARPNYPGYSHCYRCGRPWPICTHHITPIDANSGCFPLCEDCWVELTPKERLPFYYQLIAEWESQGAQKHCRVPWFLYKRQIIQAALNET
jgi:hypothetical protein